MKKKCALLTIAGIVSSVMTASALAFYDEMISLRNDLKLYETAHATDFSEVLNQLGEITGSVFTDVKDDDWFQPYVTSLAEWHIVSGFRNKEGKLTGEFKPGNSVTVAEVLKMAMAAIEIDTSTCGTSTPTHTEAKGHWAQMYVTCGEKMKMRILSQKTIDLNRTATRAEVVSIVLDVFGDEAPALLSSFKDTMNSPYESDIAYARLLGIVSGDKDMSGKATGNFRPNMLILRAEVAKVVYERLKIEVRREMASKGTPAI